MPGWIDRRSTILAVDWAAPDLRAERGPSRNLSPPVPASRLGARQGPRRDPGPAGGKLCQDIIELFNPFEAKVPNLVAAGMADDLGLQIASALPSTHFAAAQNLRPESVTFPYREAVICKEIENKARLASPCSSRRSPTGRG